MLKPLAIATALTCALDGYYCQSSPATDPACSSFTVGADWLYLRPFSSSMEYARIVSESPEITRGRRECIGSHFESGYEIFATYASPEISCCYAFDLKGTYTRFKSSENSKTHAREGEILTPLIGFIPEEELNTFLQAQSHLSFDLQGGSAVFGWMLSPSCPLRTRLFGGASYTSLQQTVNVVYFDSATSSDPLIEPFTQVEITSEFKGVGPRVGFSASWDMWCGFGMFAEFAANMLIARKTGDLYQESSASTLELDWSETFCKATELVPQFDAIVGLSFSLNCSCLSLALQGGYRTSYFYNAFQTLQISGNNLSTTPRLIDSATWTTNTPFSLGGWFAGAAVIF